MRKRFAEKLKLITDLEKFDNLIDTAVKLRNTVKGWGNAYSFCHTENIKANPKDVTMVQIFESLDKQLGSRFFYLLEKNEVKPAGKRWGEFHLTKFGIPLVKSFLSKKNLKEARKRKRLRKFSKKPVS